MPYGVTPPTADLDPGEALAELIGAVEAPDAVAAEQARRRHDRLTKPPGSLGRLEDVGVRLAGISRACPPPVPERAAVAVFAADHGVHAQGVSPWPQAVTAQMVLGFGAGGAAINAIAHEVGAEVVVIDIGVATALPDHLPDHLPGAGGRLLRRRVRDGTADLSVTAAMSQPEALAAILTGASVAQELITDGHQILITGDMGIANTTAAAALIAAVTGEPAAEVTGRGTGIDAATLSHKIAVIDTALTHHRPDPARPLELLAAVGGLEHAGLIGLLLRAAASRTPVILDGVNAGAAALVAALLAPPAVGSWFAGHRSAEPGAQIALTALGLAPLLELELRLGEGTGGALALPLVRSAARVLTSMATLDQAGIDGPG